MNHSETAPKKSEMSSPTETGAAPAYDSASLQVAVVTDESGYLHLAFVGELGFSTLLTRSEPLDEFLGPDGYARRVLLNFAQIKQLDTSGVSWLITCHKRFLEKGGMLILHSIPPFVNQIIRLLRLDRLLHICRDLPSARALALQESP